MRGGFAVNHEIWRMFVDNIFELKKERQEALNAADAVLARAESAGRQLTEAENNILNENMTTVKKLNVRIETREGQTTLRKQFGPHGPFDALRTQAAAPAMPRGQNPMSADYTESFMSFLRSGGKQATSELSEGFDSLFGGFRVPAMPGASAAMYEGVGGGSTTSGGYAVSIPTDSQIVPLAVPDLGVRSVAKILTTSTDLKIPSQSSFSTAGIKAESGSSSNQFSESNPSLSQFVLSAWMVGLTHTVSWELLQDVQMFQEFGVRDLINAIDIYEDGLFVTGTGTNQPQGLIGNVGTGTGAAYAVEPTGAYLLQSTLDCVGTLKAQYFPGSSWLMSRATATAIRKAQLQSNLFAQVWTRENGRDLLHGFPVTYSGSMPALPTATTTGVTPILFGSFQDGYIIGDRGGSGTFVKIVDQPLATSGLTVLLGYKRVDGRVRRSEAIQGISISHS
jgi:HK97 family phage major capsid protein